VVRRSGLAARCSFHGLRKAGCVYFAERGCSASEIASWSGHLSLREVERYVREANRKKMAANALRRVLEAEAAEAEAENETGQKVSNPSAV